MKNLTSIIILALCLVLSTGLQAQLTKESKVKPKNLPGQFNKENQLKEPKNTVKLPKGQKVNPSVAPLPSSGKRVEDVANVDLSAGETLEVPFQDGQMIAIRSALSEDDYIAYQGSVTNLSVVIEEDDDARTASYWTLESAGDGYFYFTSSFNGRVLEIKDGNANPDAFVSIDHKNGTDAQKFRFIPAGDGYYFIVPKLNSTLVLDIKGGKARPNSPIWTQRINRSNAQKFAIETIDQSIPLKRYKVQVYSFVCQYADDGIREDIEIFGQLKATIRYSGKDYRVAKVQEKAFWDRSENYPLVLYRYDPIYHDRGTGPQDWGYFYAPEADFNDGKITISLNSNLWEHDSTSPHDKLNSTSRYQILTSSSSESNRTWNVIGEGAVGVKTKLRIEFEVVPD